MQVLIADDSAVSRRLLRGTVSQWGYEPVVVNDGDEAWFALSAPAAPRLAILDWQMPGVDGPEICRRLRSREGLRYIYTILLTGTNSPANVVEGLKAGADDFVTKPFNPEELEQRLRTGRRIVELQDRLLAAQETLRIQATHDALTGLWNRAEILHMLENEWDRMERQHSSLGVLMVDVDYFKQVNDVNGHQAGDEVLKSLGRVLPPAVRSYDQVGRYGGEEFLIILPNATLKSSLNVGERVRTRVERSPIALGENKLEITVSVGGAASASGKDSPKDVIRRADQALYLAKNAGRNRVCTFTEALALERCQSGPTRQTVGVN